MENRPKALLIRSPGMGSLRYIIANLNGTIALVIPTEDKTAGHFLVKEVAVQKGCGWGTRAIEIGVDELLSIVEQLDMSLGEGV